MSRDAEVRSLISQAKKLGRQYHDLMGRPLGVTGEIGENEAARLADLDLCEARQEGYDAIAQVDGRRVQIKCRRILPGSRGGRLPSINIEKKWDTVMLVLLDERYEPFSILEADRRKVRRTLLRPGSKARNERGQLSISQFRAIANEVWSADRRPTTASH